MIGLRTETRVAVRAARAAGHVLMAQFGGVRRVWHKGPKDLASSADVAAERCIARILSRAFPAIGFLGEESGHRGADSKDLWIVDPLDGTSSFVNGLPNFCVAIALAREGQRVDSAVVLLPRLDELYVAERGRGAFLNGRRIRVSHTRRLCDAMLMLWLDDRGWGNSRLRGRLTRLVLDARDTRIDGGGVALAYVAAGRVDAYWEQSAYPWDMAAGSLLVAEAGGRVTNGQGGPLDLGQRTILATNGRLHRAVLRHLVADGA